MRRPARLVVLCGAALVAAALAAVAIGAAAQEPTRSFPTRVELVAVELIVVDANGRPLRDLRPDEFRLEVQGRPHRVVTAEFVPLADEPEEAPPAVDQGFTTNENARPGRLVLLVVDTSNIDVGKGRGEIAAASRVLDRLGSTDRVGLLTIPSSGPREEFTADRERIRAALTRVVGSARFGGRRLLSHDVSLVEALACSDAEQGQGMSPGMEGERCSEAIQRECPGGDRDCRYEVLAAAFDVSVEYRQTQTSSRALLKATFDTLRPLQGQKVVVLVSQGLGFPEMGARPGAGGFELQQLVSAAAASRVAFYVVPVRTGAALAGADSDLPSDLIEEDRRLHFWGLESLAVESRGAVLRGEPERAFERVLRETAGFYRLGFEPEGDDRNGKSRKLKVSVTRPGLVVRARPSAVFEPPASERETKDALVAALRSPTLATGLPLCVATWTLAGSEPGKVRLLIGAEVGGEAERRGLALGYVLLDGNGKLAASASQPMRRDAAAEGPIPYSTSAGGGARRLHAPGRRAGRSRAGRQRRPSPRGEPRAGGDSRAQRSSHRPQARGGRELPSAGRARGDRGHRAGARRDLQRGRLCARGGLGFVRDRLKRDRSAGPERPRAGPGGELTAASPRPGADRDRGARPGWLSRTSRGRRRRDPQGCRRAAVPYPRSLDDRLGSSTALEACTGPAALPARYTRIAGASP